MRQMMEVSEAELHAYIDDELPLERRRFVAEWLEAHPVEANRFEAYRRDGEAIARIFAAIDLPDVIVRPPVRIDWTRPLLRLAASMALVMVGISGGWLAHDRTASTLDSFGHEAAAVHTLVGRADAGELATRDSGKVADRVTEHLGVTVRLPVLDELGFQLAAARLLPSPEGHAAQIVFRDASGQEVTVYLRARPGAVETPFRTIHQTTVTTVVWEGDDLLCAISGNAAPELLQKIGREIYDAIET